MREQIGQVTGVDERIRVGSYESWRGNRRIHLSPKMNIISVADMEKEGGAGQGDCGGRKRGVGTGSIRGIAKHAFKRSALEMPLPLLVPVERKSVQDTA